ncbi:MAG: naringenin-chalcone synthase [Bdellovibrionales bacterium]|nr:naringenin-chalcone synthase [Bdellovibrionales bacterium]
MKPIIALTGFEQRLPKQQFEQELSLRRIAEVHSLNGDVTTEQMTVLLKRYGVKAEQISRRYYEDITIAEKGEGILARAEFFSQRGLEIVSSFYSDTALAPDHLIHVTCTGYVSPSAVQHLVTDRSWRGTGVTHAYHMGCYAALPAIRIAEGLVASRNRHVDIIHTEMCLHMDRTQHSPEQLVVQSLFADGHIKYSAVPAEAAQSGYRVLAVDEWIIPDTAGAMSWITADGGMKMTLSRHVPAHVAIHIREFVLGLCRQAEIDLSNVLKRGLFAVHPGGPKIIDAIKEKLELTESQVAASRRVLFERGNMSSATLPHIWQIISDSKPASGQHVISLAFGPGLTVFGAVFESI